MIVIGPGDIEIALVVVIRSDKKTNVNNFVALPGDFDYDSCQWYFGFVANLELNVT